MRCRRVAPRALPCLVLLACLTPGAPAVAAPSSLRATDAAPPASAASAAPAPRIHDPNDDAPPPSSWDLTRTEPGLPPPALEGPGMLPQLVRTVAALMGVLALIYLIGKVIAPRLMRGMGPRSSGGLRVVDRIGLDGRSALVVVQLADGPRYVLGLSDRGVHPIDRLEPQASAAAADAGAAFNRHLGAEVPAPAPKE